MQSKQLGKIDKLHEKEKKTNYSYGAKKPAKAIHNKQHRRKQKNNILAGKKEQKKNYKCEW